MMLFQSRFAFQGSSFRISCSRDEIIALESIIIRKILSLKFQFFDPLKVRVQMITSIYDGNKMKFKKPYLSCKEEISAIHGSTRVQKISERFKCQNFNNFSNRL